MRLACTLLVWLAVIATAVLPAVGGHAGLHAFPDAQAAGHQQHGHEESTGSSEHDHAGGASFLGHCEAMAGHCLVFIGPSGQSIEVVRHTRTARRSMHGGKHFPDRAHETETPPPRA